MFISKLKASIIIILLPQQIFFQPHIQMKKQVEIKINLAYTRVKITENLIKYSKIELKNMKKIEN